MKKNKILSGGGKNLIGGGMWVLRGAVEGGKWGKGEGSVDWVPPVHPLKDMLNINLH